MDEPKVQVYTVQPGSWLSFTDKDGLGDALDLSEPLRVVRASDYEKLVAKLNAMRAVVTRAMDAAEKALGL